MSTPTIRAALDTFQQAANRGTAVYLSPELVQELRAALKAEPEGGPPSPSGYAYRYHSPFGDTCIRFNGGEEVNGGRPIEAVPYWFAPSSAPAAPPASEAPAEALAARPLLERVAQLGDVIGRQTVAQVQQLAEQADAWLRSNPPGQPVAIEPRGCPTPGACSCVEPTPPAPEPGEVGEVGEVAQWLLSMRELAGEHNPEERRQFTRAAALLQQQEAELAALRDAAHPTLQDAIKLAEGCHDYSGGHSGAEGEAWHGAIDTVVAVLKKATDGPWDSQTMAVFGVGSEAQAGEVGELLTNNGAFKGAHGIEGLLSADAFWEQQPYGTRLYYGDGIADYLHRGVLRSAATLLQQQEAELAALRGVPVAVSERLRIVKAGIRAGYNLGHHHTVESGWGDPDEVADDFAQETLDDIGLPPAPQCLMARMADELDRLQPLPAFPPVTSHPLAAEARALLQGTPAIPQPAPQAGEVEA
jgi:hypothetical protein